MAGHGAAATVAVLGTAQTIAWASSQYLPAILARPMARDLGVSVPTVYAAFSVALLVAAFAGPWAGRAIDRWGGRPVLAATSLVFALGLAALAHSSGPVSLFAAWIVLGVAMGAGLYEAAFAALVRLHGHDARRLITGITLVAGFASTVGWPLSAWMETSVGWRGACLGWAALHLLVGLPLNAALPRAGALAGAAAPAPAFAAEAAPPPRWAAPLLALAFAASWFVGTAMAAHLPALLQAGGAAPAAAVAAAALVGPAQVAGRLFEFGLLRRVHPLRSARAAALLHPAGVALFAAGGAPWAAGFALLHGAGNGILTIAKGTLPLVLFGPAGYGRRQGLLLVPARLAQALSPWLFGIWIERLGIGALWISAAIGAAAWLLLRLLPAAATRR